MDHYHIIIYALLILGGIGFVAAVILYITARRFYVEEDPRKEQIDACLPQANCGGCGYAGCKSFADACLAKGSLDGLNCPVGGGRVMSEIATILECTAHEAEEQVAVIRCQTDCNKSRVTQYDGAKSCAIEHALYRGDTECAYGCLGQGDCVVACTFGAITFHPKTGTPQVDESRCTACGMCVKSCPRSIIELRLKQSSRIYVSCVNKEKGAVARKTCTNACIGCSKCAKNCPSNAITIAQNLAWIDDARCTQCGVCIADCPTGAIVCDEIPVVYSKKLEDIVLR